MRIYQKVEFDKRKTPSPVTAAKISDSVKKLWADPEYRKRMTNAHLGKYSRTEEGKKSFTEKMSGEKHPQWISDRSLLKKRDQRNDSAYIDWRQKVYKRDEGKCRMSNEECVTKIEAHHILSWRDHPKLRYEVNNGITLCKFHHPRKKSEETRLSPYLQSLINTVWAY